MNLQKIVDQLNTTGFNLDRAKREPLADIQAQANEILQRLDEKYFDDGGIWGLIEEGFSDPVYQDNLRAEYIEYYGDCIIYDTLTQKFYFMPIQEWGDKFCKGNTIICPPDSWGGERSGLLRK